MSTPDVRSHMLEAELLACVVEVAHLHGWLVAHFRPAQTVRGWRTPVEADGAGFPDLVLAHLGAGRLVFAELKREKGAKIDPRQTRWLATLDAVAQVAAGDALAEVKLADEYDGTPRPPRRPAVEVVLWRPSHYLDGDVERTLRVSPEHRARALGPNLIGS